MTKSKFKKFFPKGAVFDRINPKFPTRIRGGETIPVGETIRVTVLKHERDTVVFEMPWGEASYLTYPMVLDLETEVSIDSEGAHTIHIMGHNGPVLSYEEIV